MNKQNIVFDHRYYRSTYINWPNQVKTIVDGYLSYTNIAHAVQKDAIQNSWDARIDKKNASSWEIEFELIESNECNYFLFTDSGTTGLTGKILMPEELEYDLPITERWGRFENVAFRKDPMEDAIGARGRGKFIFLAASKYKGKTSESKDVNKLILYETLRDDGIYRMGYRTIVTTDSPIEAFDDEIARIKIKEITYDTIKPLKKIGTRVIIVDPIDELIDDVKNNEFLKYIEETWWEIIRDYKVIIKVKFNQKTHYAKQIKYTKFPTEDSARYKILLKQNIPLHQAPNYKINTINIVYDSNGNIPEEIRGISIQRGGMKVCTIPIRWLDRSLANNIYGYINFDKNLQKELQKYEGIEHYSFDFRKLIPKFIKQFIEDEVEKFIRDKLGIYTSNQTQSYEAERSAELKALFKVNKIASQLGIIGRGVVNISKSSNIIERQLLPIRLSFGKFKFPSDTLRVDYGQSIKDIRLKIENDTKYDHKFGVRFSIMFNENDEIFVYLDNLNCEVKEVSSLTVLNDLEQEINKKIFKFKGKYTFFAKLISLDNDNRGDIIHKLSKHFWVEENPPQKGIFDEIESIDYPEEMKMLMGEAVPIESHSYKFLYNRLHPAKKAIENDEEKLMNYLIELMCLELTWIDSRSANPKIFNSSQLENPTEIIRKLINFFGEIKFRIS